MEERRAIESGFITPSLSGDDLNIGAEKMFAVMGTIKYTRAVVRSSLNLSIGHYAGGMKREP